MFFYLLFRTLLLIMLLCRNCRVGGGGGCSGGKPFKKDSVKRIQDLCLDFDLVHIDVFSMLYKSLVRLILEYAVPVWCPGEFEIRNLNILRGGKKIPFIQRRLDYWLINEACQDDIEKSDFIYSINSDHSTIFLRFKSLDKPEDGLSF